MEYKAGQEYKMKYIDKDQKEHEATYTPDKDTNIAGMINGFKDKTKDFFKLLSIDDKSLDESRKITEEKDSGLKDALDNDVELFDDIYLYLDEYIEDEDTKSEIEGIIDKYTGIGGSAEDLDEDSEEYKSELEDCINEIEDLLNLNESKKITESEDSDFFFNQGLEKAKEVTKREGCLNCCDIVSKEVSELAKQYHINCKPVNLKVFTKNDNGTSHSAILYNNYGKGARIIIDYTQKQFFGSNSPEDTKCDVIDNIWSSYDYSYDGVYFDGALFSNNKFYYDGKEIKDVDSYNDDWLDFIRDFNDGIIKADNDAIIYLYGSMKITESKKITESEDNKVTDPNHDVKEYVYDNEDIDDLDIDTIKEDIEDYLGEEVVSDKLAQEILNTMNNIKNTVKYYTPYNGEKLIELNANHTILDLDVPDTLTDEQFSEATDEYWYQARTAMEDLEIELGQDVYGEGRMGRHICVKNTYDNAINYEKLVSKQKEAEKNLINNINDYMKDLVSDNKTESKKITESENKLELADMLIEINRYYIDYIDNISFFIDLANVAGIDYDKVYDWYKSIKEDENDDLEESKKITESEDKYTYDKDEEEKLRKIFKDLQDGYSYGYDMKNVSYPIFKKVLSIGKSFGQKDYGTNYINVNYYGGTSHKITLDNLKWIMNKIFNMTPSKFLSKFIRNDKSTIKD